MKSKLLILLTLLIFLPLAMAADFAYIVKDSNGVDQYLTSQITANGYNYDVITEPLVQSTNFSNYRGIIIGDTNLASPSLIPIHLYRTLTINSYDYYKRSTSDYQLGWTASSGSKSSPTILNFLDSSNPIVEGLPSTFRAYTTTNLNLKTAYLKGQKPTGTVTAVYSSISTDSVVATLTPGKKLLDGRNLTERNVYFGITKAQYWTPETKTLFTNSLNWLLYGEDRDEDSYYSDVDCNDMDPAINPGAEDIPYDNIDQDCSGSDYNDVDGDGYISDIVDGPDCDDFDSVINPSNPDPYNNCLNDSPVILSLSSSEVYETELLSVSVEAIDPEEDFLLISIDDPRFILEDGVLYWQTDYNDSGEHSFTVSVSDGEYTIGQEITVNVLNTNRPPVFSTPVNNLSWNEDSSLIINLSNYFTDLDQDSLSYGIDSTSDNDEISLLFTGPIFNFTSSHNWNGEDWIVFYATDGEEKTLSDEITITVYPVNDAPELVNDIPSFTIDEDSSLESAFDLNEYFNDIDSDSLQFESFSSSNINITLENGLVSFYPIHDYNGEEVVYFTASDPEYVVSSNTFTITINDVGEIPEFLEQSCLTQVIEDSSSTCNLNVFDFENDSLEFTVEEYSNLNCIFLDNNVTYSPTSNYYGEASCLIKVEDKDGFDTYLLEVNVSAVNDAPELINDIPSFTIDEDSSLESAFDLNEYFNDIDSDSLQFESFSSSNINITLENGLVSFYPIHDYNGEEVVYFTASDGELITYSNNISISITDLGEIPYFTNVSCVSEMEEDSSLNCIVEAQDFENDTLSFSASQENKLNCDFEGNLLTYSPVSNYNGEASCLIKVEDKDGFDTYLLEVNVSAINDAPTITSSITDAVIRIIEGRTKLFTASASDVDGDSLNKSWLIDNQFVSSSNSYEFSKPVGSYNLSFLASDGSLESTRLWRVVVGDISEFTCSEVGGDICSDKEICPTDLEEVSDTSRCCMQACIPKFSDADSCDQLSSNITIRVVNPDSSDEFDLGDRFRVEVEITNNLDDDQDFDVIGQLYDLTEDETIGDEIETSIDVESGRKRTASFYVESQDVLDMDTDNDIAIYVKVEDNVCSQAYQSLKFERPENLVEISKVDMQSELLCGDETEAKVRIDNLGDSEEEGITLSLEARSLDISYKSEAFDLEEFGEKDSKLLTIPILIKEDAKSGEYNLVFTAVYDSSRRESFTQKVKIDCQEEITTQNTESLEEDSSKISLSSVNQPVETSSRSNMLIVLLMSMLTIILAAALVFYLVFIKK